MTSSRPDIALIIGSAPDATRASDWNRDIFHQIITINNAWRIRQDWDFLIHPEDFPDDKRPPALAGAQKIITADHYVPIQNQYGGFVYAGGTMAFTAAYWALGALRPDILVFVGCDMVYPKNGQSTHFYGTGSADPLRPDITLQSLEAKSTRLFYHAAAQDCHCFNLSSLPESRLVFPRTTLAELESMTRESFARRLEHLRLMFDENDVEQVISRETELGYMVESGRYWEHQDMICPQKLSGVDDIWMSALRNAPKA